VSYPSSTTLRRRQSGIRQAVILLGAGHRPTACRGRAAPMSLNRSAQVIAFKTGALRPRCEPTARRLRLHRFARRLAGDCRRRIRPAATRAGVRGSACICAQGPRRCSTKSAPFRPRYRIPRHMDCAMFRGLGERLTERSRRILEHQTGELFYTATQPAADYLGARVGERNQDDRAGFPPTFRGPNTSCVLR